MLQHTGVTVMIDCAHGKGRHRDCGRGQGAMHLVHLIALFCFAGMGVN